MRSGRSHAYNFEKAKQKFDQSQLSRSGRSSHNSNKPAKPQQFQSNIPKRSNYLVEPGAGGSDLSASLNMDPGVISPYDDNSSSKGNFSMTSSINLDGLKVSDDE